jgi:APA family basic amino acid/polyamine antiporter
MKQGSATHINILPVWNWRTVNLWATISFGMSGLELAGIMVAEVRDPERTFPRAAWIASPGITLFYSSATIALLILLPPERISEMNGLSEAGDAAAHALGFSWIAPLIALLVVGSGMGQLGGIGTAISRLPFAAGADRLLPAAFARIHPRWHTPHVSIVALGAVATFLLLAMQLGDTLRAAYDELVSLMIITGYVPYFYIFGSSWKAGNRWSVVAGFLVVVLTILCAVVPTEEINNVWLFEGKLAAGTLLVVGSAWLVYRRHSVARSDI